jgi:hypothetical protein
LHSFSQSPGSAGLINHFNRVKPVARVMIAAPDINIEVALQRTEHEGTRWMAERWTTSTSPGDKAIGVSEWLFGGGRFGKLSYDYLIVPPSSPAWYIQSTLRVLYS